MVSALAMIRAIGWRSTGAISRPTAAPNACFRRFRRNLRRIIGRFLGDEVQLEPGAAAARAGRAAPDGPSSGVRAREAHPRSVEQAPVQRLLVRVAFERDEFGPRPAEPGAHSPGERLELGGLGIDREQLLRRTQPRGQLGQLASDAEAPLGGFAGIWFRAAGRPASCSARSCSLRPGQPEKPRPRRSPARDRPARGSPAPGAIRRDATCAPAQARRARRSRRATHRRCAAAARRAARRLQPASRARPSAHGPYGDCSPWRQARPGWAEASSDAARSAGSASNPSGSAKSG